MSDYDDLHLCKHGWHYVGRVNDCPDCADEPVILTEFGKGYIVGAIHALLGLFVLWAVYGTWQS